MDRKTLSIGELKLDVSNPRHQAVSSQREAIRELIDSQRQRLVVLANDIKEFGLSPMERMLVVGDGNSYTVVEGNRRLAAIRLANNPDLARDTPIAAAIKRVSKDAVMPTEVDCSIALTREAAAHWMELKHAGTGEGAAVVPWQTLARHRFSEKPGTQAAKAIAFLDALEAGYPDNDVVQELIITVADKRLTTLGRLVADPSFKKKFGMTEVDGAVQFHFGAAVLRDAMEQVLGDVGSDISVSEIRTKEQRSNYLDTILDPPDGKRAEEAKSLGEAPSKGQPKPKKRRSKPAKKPEKPFKDLHLGNLGDRVVTILEEFRTLDVDKVANASSLIVRAILELSVEQYIEKKYLNRSQKFKDRIRKCLKQIDPTEKDPKYQAVRTGLQDGSSLYSVSTLHGFVHNPDFHPDGTHIRMIARNLGPFLQALNDDV